MINKKLIKELCSDYQYKIIENEKDLYLEDLQDGSIKITNWENLRLFFLEQYENKLQYEDKGKGSYFKNIISQLRAI